MNEEAINCPFYGRQLFVPLPLDPKGAPFLLLNQKGNQCAVEIGAYFPCLLEIEQREIDWRTCPRVRDLRIL